MGLTAFSYVSTEKETLTYPIDNSPVIPFGIQHMDNEFLMGQKPWSPQLNVIQGGGGSRKTTTMIKFLITQFICGAYPETLKTNIYTLESGVSIEGYLMRMRQQVATLLLIYEFYTKQQYTSHNDKTPTEYLWWLIKQPLPQKPAANLISDVRYTPQGSNVSYMLCTLSSDFIEGFYNKITSMFRPQFEAWLLAGEIVSKFNVEVFGTSEHYDMDTARKRSMNTVRLENLKSHWLQEAEKADKDGYKVQNVMDYLQAVSLPSGSNDHYSKQTEIVPLIEDWIKEAKSTFWVLSQEGISHQRDFMARGDVLGSSGGDVLKNASQNNWRVSYDKNKNPFEMVIHRPIKSRRGSHPDLKLMIEPKSGTIFGNSLELM